MIAFCTSQSICQGPFIFPRSSCINVYRQKQMTWWSTVCKTYRMWHWHYSTAELPKAKRKGPAPLQFCWTAASAYCCLSFPWQNRKSVRHAFFKAGFDSTASPWHYICHVCCSRHMRMRASRLLRKHHIAASLPTSKLKGCVTHSQTPSEEDIVSGFTKRICGKTFPCNGAMRKVQPKVTWLHRGFTYCEQTEWLRITQ